ncbi:MULTISPECIES: HPP family protein [Haloferax]|uniref:HPP family protein n=1 Tax=Haloferax massiliensis TaxID=1476858 RepID=A0A0D6JX14_9EURY|nr:MULTISPECIES: HPP family protein [Haloferax]MDS0240897.1 HPP family protein [Haloferax sp. S2CR25]MDS0444018.1 HPP family protein [Haloferax sp. S2CR25-2]CQR53546.1 HPP family protein [Haloferax massiliensis]
MSRRGLETGLSAGLLVAALGGIAWATGEPFVFPSLGPTAFVLAFRRRSGRARSTRIVVGHAVGAVVGFAAYALVASGATLDPSLSAASTDTLRLVASAALSVAATSWGMVELDAVHPPACATTLIVSLGLLSTPRSVATIVASVVVLVGVHRAADAMLSGGYGDARTDAGARR